MFSKICMLYFVQCVIADLAFESYTWLSDWGSQFEPSTQLALLLSSNAKSLLRCAALCNLNRQCRTFDYDTLSSMCRLFDDPVSSGNMTSSAQTKRTGSLKILPSFFTNYGEPCSKCLQNRYLTCSLSGTCECPAGSCWNGYQCEKRKNYNASSTQIISNWCIEPIFDIFWPFDNNVYDSKLNFSITTSGSPQYTTSYWNIGTALNLVRASSQYFKISSGQVLFYSLSFTIQTWIYPIAFTSVDYAIFGQCQTNMTNKCMYFIVRNYKLTCGFQNNDISGATSLSMNRWWHIACVYNLPAQTLQVYVNGILDGSRSSAAFQGLSGDTTIGVTYATSPGSNYFNGYLDQMEFVSRVKTDTEILRDATLIAYYSFDTNLTADNGPNGIHMTAIGSPSSVTGRVNQAIQINPTSYIRTTYVSFPALGVSNQAHSYSFWVKPTGSYASSTILYVSSVVGWCVSIITMTSSGNIRINSFNGDLVVVYGPVLTLSTWTHIGATYSQSNGFKLYINGIYYSTSGAFSYIAANNLVYVVIGNDLGNGYSCTPLYGGGFTGAVDEFYVYSRELTASEILAVANP